WPECPWGYLNRGNAYSKSERLEEAVADFNAALERDPAFLLAYLNRGFARLHLKQPELALADLCAAAALGYDDAAVYVAFGAALDEALQRLTQAVEEDPEFIDALRSRAILLARRARWDEAAQDINFCLHREPRRGETLYAAACVSAWLAQSWFEAAKTQPQKQ